jgi:dTDP-4-dehydrorhamnose reductase
VTPARVLVVGSTGMVGRAVTARLRAEGHDVVPTARREGEAEVVLDLADPPDLPPVLAGFDVIVDASGVLRGQLDYPGDGFRLAAARVNTVWPLALAAAAAATGTRVVHVSTDAVFGPGETPADEAAPAWPTEPYGQSKLLGESDAAHVLNVRCSVVGPAPDRGAGLWEWVVGQPRAATVRGYADHAWAGCTSDQLAQLTADLVPARSFARVREDGPSPHFVPNGTVPKADVVRLLAGATRPDLIVEAVTGPRPLPRPLAATHRGLDEVYTGPRGWPAALAGALGAAP